MTTVVLDSIDLDGMVRDATGEGLVAETVTEAKPAVAAETVDEPDLDKEGVDGLTNREKIELSAKMLKAVGKRVREKREAEEFASEQYNLRLAAEKRVQELQGTKPEPEVKPEPKVALKRESYATDEEYIAALVSQGVADALAQKTAEDNKAAAERRQADLIRNAQTMITKAMDLVPDFEDTVSAVDEVIPPAVVAYMQKSPMLAELGYHLAKNPDVIKDLQNMDRDDQLVAIGEIKGTLKPFSKSEGKDAASSASKSKPQASQPESTTGEGIPSAARKAAPVITPISSNGSSGEVRLENVRDHIAEFARTKGVNLSRRQRH